MGYPIAINRKPEKVRRACAACGKGSTTLKKIRIFTRARAVCLDCHAILLKARPRMVRPLSLVYSSDVNFAEMLGQARKLISQKKDRRINSCSRSNSKYHPN